MARDADARFPTALVLASEIEAWLDGARKREQALEITAEALEGVADAARMRERANRLRAEGDALLVNMPSWRPEEDKAAGWARQDEAAALRRSAELAELGVDQGLHGALRVAPDLLEAHAALAERYRLLHAEAEARRDDDEKARAETLVRLHTQALPESDTTRLACATYLRGDGALTLVTDPPGAEVALHRYELHNRRLVEIPVRSLGTTPLRAVPLPMGSYMAVLTHPDCDEVRYPASVPRLGHWAGIPPGGHDPTPIWLPPSGYLGTDEVYVPAGWFKAGGDPDATNGKPGRQRWCDALVMHRFPITNRQYIAFLDGLVAQGRVDDALRHAPRERVGVDGQEGALIYGFDGNRFSLVPDADGDLWLYDWPVFQVDWHGARAYLAWLAAHTRRPWRLPGELEWEKAARGVDGRWFPWGDFGDPSWFCTTNSHRGQRLPVVVDSFPIDRSPYGVRGLGGNVYDWCLEGFDSSEADDERVAEPDPPSGGRGLRAARGGTWDGSVRAGRIGGRSRPLQTSRYSNLGFRGVFRPRRR
jgi:serine/threonine-protein kinase